MIAYTESLIYNAANDAEYRANVAYISQTLDSFGLTKTADTGQVNLATVARGTSIWQLMGYEVRQFTDALQATAPVVFRIDYMTGDVTNRLGITLTVGTASDGAGNIVGPQTVALLRRCNDSTTTTQSTITSYLSGAPNRLNTALFANHTNTDSFYSVLWMGIERSKDGAGNDTGDGVWAVLGRGYEGLQHAYIPFTRLGLPPVETSLNAVCSVGRTNAFAGRLGTFPITPWCGAPQNPITGFMVAGTTDVAIGQGTLLSPYGKSIPYVMPANVSINQGIIPGIAGSRLLMRWD